MVAVAIGFDVRSAAQDQPVEAREHALDVGVARQFDGSPPAAATEAG